MKVIRFTTENCLELKKPHPCGNRIFSVLRVGSEVRIQCAVCGRDMTLGREKLEKAIKRVLPKDPSKTEFPHSNSEETNKPICKQN